MANHSALHSGSTTHQNLFNWCLIAASALLALAMIVYRLLDAPPPNTTFFRASLLTMLLSVSVLMAATGIGAFLMKSRNVWVQYKGYGLILSSILGLILIMPGMVINRVTLSQNSFEIRDFFWLDSQNHTVDLTSVKSLSIRDGVFGRNATRSCTLIFKDRTVRTVPLDFASPEALDAILRAAQTHGVKLEQNPSSFMSAAHTHRQ